MSAAAWTLQQAIYAALMANGGVTALSGGRVFDAVPRDPSFPYVVIGEADERDAGAGASEHHLALHLWSRSGGTCEIKQLAAAVKAALDGAPLVLSGHTLVSLTYLSANYTRQSDGETYRGSLRFRALTEVSE